MSANPTERRAFGREAVVTETLGVGAHGGGRGFTGRTRDLSPGGAFVETDAVVAIGDELQLFIGSPHDRSALRVAAVVVRVEPGGFGARFADEDEAARAAIVEFIERHCRGLPKPQAGP